MQRRRELLHCLPDQLAPVALGHAGIRRAVESGLPVQKCARSDLGREWVQRARTFHPGSALLYPGIVGETAVNEGRGTEAPFTRFGAPWLDADALADRLNSLGLPGVRFEAMVYTLRSIDGVATKSRHPNERVKAARVIVTDVGAVTPLEIGVQALSLLIIEARRAGVGTFFPERRTYLLY
jgi:uncharacterized protein YbbC (DUF1343 family)